MPRLARWFIKTALVYLAVTLALALFRAAQAAGVVPGSGAALWLPQLHLLTVGWLTQLIFGVAFWLFPRPQPDAAGPLVMGTAYALLNLGLVLRLLCEPSWLSEDLRLWGLVGSAGLQWGASLLLVTYFWRRVRSK